MKSVQVFFSLVAVVSNLLDILDATPTCTEECPAGFEQVSGLSHCYKLMTQWGPMSQNKAVVACGYEEGATVLTLDNANDDQLIRNHFWANYQSEIEGAAAYEADMGFWTGYVRPYSAPPKEKSSFVNLYSGAAMPEDQWAVQPDQPSDYKIGPFSQEACVARMKFSSEFRKGDNDSRNGLDDYGCGFPHFVICMHRDVNSLNQQAYNTALQNGVSLPADGTCRLDWDSQNDNMKDMVVATRKAEGKKKKGNTYKKLFPKVLSPSCS